MLRSPLALGVTIGAPLVDSNFFSDSTSPDNAFISGASKDGIDSSNWQCTAKPVTPKDEIFNAYGSIFMVGSSGRYAAECSRTQLVLMMLKAYWSGLKLFPEMWRSRRKIRGFARLTNRDFAGLIRRHRISLRALTLGT